MVGYKKLALQAGFAMYAPMFTDIGADPISIQDLVPTGDDVGGWGDISIQVVDADGNIDGEYAWYTADNSGLDGNYWLDPNTLEVADASFNDGDSFLIYSDNAFVLQCKGEVAFEAVLKNIVAGFNSFGNSKMSSISIQDLIPTGEDIGGWGDVNIQTVDADGNIDGEYAWYTAENSGLEGNYWLDPNTLEIANLTIATGGAFLLYSDNAAQIEIPEYQAE